MTKVTKNCNNSWQRKLTRTNIHSVACVMYNSWRCTISTHNSIEYSQLWELMITQMINKFLSFNETLRFITVITRTHQMVFTSIINPKNTVHMQHFYLRYILIFPSIYAQLSLFFLIFQFTLCTRVLQLTCAYLPRKFNLPWVLHPNIVNLLNTHFYPPVISPHHFLLA
jgi:hypothetical protein